MPEMEIMCGSQRTPLDRTPKDGEIHLSYQTEYASFGTESMIQSLYGFWLIESQLL